MSMAIIYIGGAYYFLCLLAYAITLVVGCSGSALLLNFKFLDAHNNNEFFPDAWGWYTYTSIVGIAGVGSSIWALYRLRYIANLSSAYVRHWGLSSFAAGTSMLFFSAAYWLLLDGQLDWIALGLNSAGVVIGSFVFFTQRGVLWVSHKEATAVLTLELSELDGDSNSDYDLDAPEDDGCAKCWYKVQTYFNGWPFDRRSMIFAVILTWELFGWGSFLMNGISPYRTVDEMKLAAWLTIVVIGVVALAGSVATYSFFAPIVVVLASLSIGLQWTDTYFAATGVAIGGGVVFMGLIVIANIPQCAKTARSVGFAKL